MTLLSALVGTTNAFLIERGRFPGKQALSILMLAPLVIPGVILGISILAFASRVADFADDMFGLELDFLRPGLPLVVLGQFSYIVAIATLTISARLRRFDRTLEEAALNLGASKAAVFGTIMLPYLRPALLGSAAISFLMSFADFNTTLMLVGADAPLTVMMYARMREGATPVLNAVSLFLMIASAVLALTLLRRGGPARAAETPPMTPQESECPRFSAPVASVLWQRHRSTHRPLAGHARGKHHAPGALDPRRATTEHLFTESSPPACIAGPPAGPGPPSRRTFASSRIRRRQKPRACANANAAGRAPRKSAAHT